MKAQSSYASAVSGCQFFCGPYFSIVFNLLLEGQRGRFSLGSTMVFLQSQYTSRSKFLTYAAHKFARTYLPDIPVCSTWANVLLHASVAGLHLLFMLRK